MIRQLLIPAVLATLGVAAPAQAQDNDACTPGVGSGIRANIVGLKDRIGRLKLELYPANTNDFLRDDTLLVRERKVFRRVWAATPPRGDVSLCISVPAPGRYALLFTHDRDGKNKFNFWRDGAGFPSNAKLGRSRPKLAQAVIDVGEGVTTTTIRAQYLRGFSGFGPVSK